MATDQQCNARDEKEISYLSLALEVISGLVNLTNFVSTFSAALFICVIDSFSSPNFSMAATIGNR